MSQSPLNLDLIITNARLENSEKLQTIGVKDGVIAMIDDSINLKALQIVNAENQLVCSGFYESHIHLDKACILDRCTIEKGTLEEAVEETGKAKKEFTEEDVFKRASRVIEMAIKKGTMGLRTFVETDPKAALRSFKAIKKVKQHYVFAIDIEICAFAQEGLTTEMETYDLLYAALKDGADLIGGCPYKDENPEKHIDLIFDLAQEFNVHVDFHLDFDLDPNNSDIPKIAKETIKRNYQGKVSIGHVTKLAAMETERREEMISMLKKADIALTVLPATDIFLNGRDHKPLIPRGMVNANELSKAGVLTTISSNNILNAFTPFGDASLLRMANMYANIAQLSTDKDLKEVYSMITENAAKLLSMQSEIKVGAPANLVIIESESAVDAIRTNAQALLGFKNGKMTFSNTKAEIYFK